MSEIKELKETDDATIFVSFKKPVLVCYQDRKYPFDKDADHNLDSEPCELLDQCQYPSIEKQVEMFIKCGQKLDVARYEEDYPVDDDYVEDIDELATPLDDVDVSRQDFDAALAYIRSQKKKESDPGSKSDPGLKSDPGSKSDPGLKSDPGSNGVDIKDK